MEENYLVIGGDGLIGRQLTKALSLKGKPFIETTRNKESCNRNRLHLDLAEDVTNWPIPTEVAAAFFMAGITSVEYCRSHPEESRTVNVEHTIQLIERLFERGVHVLFPSTSLVFDGTKPFRKTSEPVSPRCLYGEMKAEVERFILSESDLGCVVRITKVAESLAPLLSEWRGRFMRHLRVEPFFDMQFSPVPLAFCLESMLMLAEKTSGGVFHLSGSRDMTYAELCEFYADVMGLSEFQKKLLIQPVRARRNLPYIETVPDYSTLDMEETLKALGITAVEHDEVIKKMLDAFHENSGPERCATE